jgi:signal transduction histidine kinase
VTDLRIAQRENKILQSQLLHAQRLDSLGTLAGGIAHDLNNTLVPVLALSDDMLHAMAQDDPFRRSADLILQSARRARDLVAQILTFARREAVEYDVFDIRDVLREFSPLMRATMPSSITIVENLDATGGVRGNRGQLLQVILNLFSNAAHAIGENPGCIYLSTAEVMSSRQEVETGKRFIQISVADTGCGMSEAVQRRLFEPFFTTRAVGRGLGLGLSVAHGIVASHQGYIDVKSVPGQGTRIDVLLPIADG